MAVRVRSSMGFLVVYVAAMVLGRVFTLESTALALFWPAAGVAMLWLVCDCVRAQLIFDAVLLFAVTTAFFVIPVGMALSASALLGAANVLQAVVARVVLAKLTGRPATGDLQAVVVDWVDLRNLVFAAVSAALVGAPIGALASWAETGDLSWSTAVDWFLRNACGILVPAAAALAFAGARGRRRGPSWRAWLTAEPRRGAVPELTVVVLLTVCAGAAVVEAPHQISLTYLMMGISAWVGFRFTPVVGGFYTLTFGILAVLLTLRGLGPFGNVEDLALRANAIQLFVAMTTLFVLLLACGASHQAMLTFQLREAEVRATSRADLLDAVNGAIADGLCVSDSWGHVLLANPAAAELGGADEHGAHVHDASNAQWYWPDGTQIPKDELPHARALRGEVVATSDVIRRDPRTGQERALAVSAVPLHFGARGSSGVAEAGPLAVVLMRDVTRQRSLERAQENFVAVVAHDLKGPLSGVLSWAELARDQLGSNTVTGIASARVSLERIEGTAARMSMMITDLLHYTVSGSAPLHITTIDLDELVDSVVSDLESPDRAAVVTHASLGAVAADELLTRQLFGNLVANAIKYVAAGVTPRIHIDSRQLNDVLEIRVSDNGIGIPQHDRTRVFDSFYRASANGAIDGSGLGLPICQRAVERHGGWIAAREGPDGTGTTIIFTLPLAATHAKGVLPTRKDGSRGAAVTDTPRVRSEQAPHAGS